MGEMTEKMYKARVQIEIVVELDVPGVCDDNAAANAEEIVGCDSQYIMDGLRIMKYVVPNSGVRCIEVKEYESKNE